MTQPTDPGRELARLPIEKMQDVLVARFVGREVASKLGFPPACLTRIATAISEITRNVVQHAGAPGEIVMRQSVQEARVKLHLAIHDRGKGIAASSMGAEASAGLGAGIPGTRKLMDEFAIESKPGAGTTVRMALFKPEGSL